MMSIDSTEVTRIVQLPPAADGSLPMVGGVAAGDAGKLYITDELNHRVLCFDSSGTSLWSSGSMGNGTGQFMYPRGVCLGRLERAESRDRCIAVADSWNRRVSFLDLDGKPVESWGCRPHCDFGEITDLRYLPPEVGESRGTWLLLDRTSHRILGLGESGELIFSAGREFPPLVMTKWHLASLSILRFLRNPGTLPQLAPRDHLYYPYRLLGQHPQSLMIWEPLSRTLKVSLWGNFIPILQVLPDTLEWVTASSSTLLGWDPKTGACYCYDASGAAQGPWLVGGRPVPSTADPPECWVQVEGSLRHLRFLTELDRSGGSAPVGSALVALSATKRRGETELHLARATTGTLIDRIDEASRMAERISQALASESPVIDACEQKTRSQDLQAEIGHLEARLLEELSPLSWLSIELRCASAGSSGRLPLGEMELADELLSILEPFHVAFRRWVDCYDQLRLGLIRAGKNALQPGAGLRSGHDAGPIVLATLRGAVEWAYAQIGPGGSGCQCGPAVSYKADEFRRAEPTGRPGVRPSRSATRFSKFLQEKGRIPVETGVGATSVKPLSLCVLPEGRFLVSLLDGHEVQCLNMRGEVTMRLGGMRSKPGTLSHPTGVLFDSEHRIWVAEAGNRRIQIWSPPYEDSQAAQIHGSADNLLERPNGLVQISSGDVLIADALANRVWSVDASLQLRPWPVSAGSEAVALSNPVSFARVEGVPTGEIWLVDRANHRLLRLDETGQCKAAIGTCGLEDDDWFEPRGVASFHDGILVVAEDREPGSLVIVSGSGSVSGRVPLDYVPGAPVTAGNLLLVPDILGDNIRIYERD